MHWTVLSYWLDYSINISCLFSMQAKSPHIPEEGGLLQEQIGMEIGQSAAQEGGKK